MHETQAASQIRIGELAAQVGLNPKTICYYEDIGVLLPPHRTPAGYRLYTADARTRLQFIAQAKAVGFTLAEIRDILTLKHAGHAPCAHVQALVTEKSPRLRRSFMRFRTCGTNSRRSRQQHRRHAWVRRRSAA